VDYLIIFPWVEQIAKLLQIHEIKVRKETIYLKITGLKFL
jgi:hypothetical protein